MSIQASASRPSRAFTLIELLVVMAIIAILAALLFPVFAQAKVSAKQIVCIAQMRQIGMALAMYATDSDGTWAPTIDFTSAGPAFAPQQPWIGYDNNNGNLATGWWGQVNRPAINPPRPGAIDPYLKSHAVKVCPAKPPQWQLALAYNWFSTSWPSSYYSRNPAAQGNEFGPGSKITRWSALGGLENLAARDSEIEESSNTLAVWEHNAFAAACNFLQGPDWFESPPNVALYRNHFNFLHREGTTTVWTDGHTRRLTYGQLRRPMFSCQKHFYP